MHIFAREVQNFRLKKAIFFAGDVEDPLADVAGGSLAELERKIRDRNERIRSAVQGWGLFITDKPMCN